MELRLLGEIQVLAGGRALDVGTPRQQAVLAALAVEPGRPVALETLVDRVWGEDPPTEVRNVLYSHLSRIRRLFADAATLDEGPVVRVERRHSGYLLDIDPDRVDIQRFGRLTDAGRHPGRPEAERVAALAEALDLWRGPPLASLRSEWAANVRENWHRRRVDAAVHWARGELGLGRTDAVITTLPVLIDEYPLAEPLEAILMTALQAAGRDAEAVDRYARVRVRLADVLGADPGPDLRALHEAILRGEPAPRPPTAAAGTAVVTVPAQLPPDVHGFSGRRAQLRRLDALLPAAPPASGPPGRPVTVAAVHGMAGVGKTALAVHWAHRVAHRFPDGQLYANLRAFDPTGTPVSAQDVVRGFLDALEVPQDRTPVTFEGQVGLYRSLLAGRRVLVLLDNARDVDQVRPLLPAAAGCLVLVTSRNRLSGLVTTAGAHPLTLAVPPVVEARELLVHRLGAGRPGADTATLDEIVAMCGRLPLALAVVATRAAVQPDLPLAVLAGELREAQGGLAEFTDPDVQSDVRAVFSWSYHRLGPAAARLFRLLGTHPGPDISMAAAASLAGRPVVEVRPLLAELVRAHLVEQTPVRYAMHDLLRAYAAELAQALDCEADRAAAGRRVLSHYAVSAHAADRLLNPLQDDPGRPATAARVSPEAPADQREALAWFNAEHPVLLATLRQADDDALSWQLAWALTRFFAYQGHWQDLIEVMAVAMGAARRLDDPLRLAIAHRVLGCAHIRRGRFHEADALLGEALRLYRGIGDLAGEAHTHRNQAWLLERQGRYAEALVHSQRAVDLFGAAGHRAGQGRALNAVGWFTAMLGDHVRAVAYCRQALEVQREIGDRFGEAETMDSLGYADLRLGRPVEAVSCYRTAVALYREFDDRYNEADSTASLGDAHHAAGDLGAARAAWQRAADMLDSLHHPDADIIRARADQDAPPHVEVSHGRRTGQPQ